jgi:hypothetical protein
MKVRDVLKQNPLTVFQSATKAAASRAQAVAAELQEPFGNHLLSLEFAARLARRGREVRLMVSPSGTETVPAYQSQALLKAITRAHAWRNQLITGQASGPSSNSDADGVR